MSVPELTRKDIEEIIQLVKSATDVTEFTLKYGATEIHLSRGEHSAAPPEPAASAAPTLPAPPAASPEPAPAARSWAAAADEFVIAAPMVGTFYRSPAPQEPPFVEVGQAVEPATVLCIIEVMKLMNSIPAGCTGTVKAILVGDGELIEFGQPLIVLQVNG